MKKRFFLGILVLLLLTSISFAYEDEDRYDEERYDDHEERYEDDYRYDDHEDRYDEEMNDRERGMPPGMKGPGGCTNEEDCMDYCMENKRECMQWKKDNKDMMPDDRMREHDEFRGDDRMHDDFMPNPEEFIHNPERFMEYCDDPEKMVEEVYKEMEKNGAFEQMNIHQERRCEDELRFLERRCMPFDEHEEDERDYCEDMFDHQEEWEHDMPSVDDMVEECMGHSRRDLERIEDEEDREVQERRMKEDYEFCKERQERERDNRKEEMQQHKDEQEGRCQEEREMIQKECEKEMDVTMIKKEMLEEGIKMCKRYMSGEDMDHILKSIDDDEGRDHARKEMKELRRTKESIKDLEEGGSMVDKVLRFFGLKDLSKDLKNAGDELGESIEALEGVKGVITDEAAKETLEIQINALKEEQAKLYEKAEQVGEESPSGFSVFVGHFVRQ